SPCQQLKLSLTKCAEVNVESVRSVKQRCQPQIGAYEDCVRANPTDTHLACSEIVKQLYACTHSEVSQSDQYMAAKMQAHSMANVQESK
ncbi:hypothetical protein HDU99_000478, partial [Rhizoclosmatium hyalinum]